MSTQFTQWKKLFKGWWRRACVSRRSLSSEVIPDHSNVLYYLVKSVFKICLARRRDGDYGTNVSNFLQNPLCEHYSQVQCEPIKDKDTPPVKHFVGFFFFFLESRNNDRTTVEKGQPPKHNGSGNPHFLTLGFSSLLIRDRSFFMR